MMSYMCSNFKRQHVCNSSFTDVFAEKGNVKIHNAEARTFASDIQHWINQFPKNAYSKDEQKCFSELHLQADCCFTLAVIQRMYSPSQGLWKLNVYSEMENLISKTTNPIVSRIRHHARYGVVLYLGVTR